MDRRHLVGIVLVLLSACAFGSGGLFAQPVYDTGVGWQALSAWRFGFGALCAWIWCLAWRDRRRGLRLLNRRTVAVAVALGILYTGNSGTYYAGLETVPVSLAALIVYIYPAVVAVLSLRFGLRLEGRRAWFALGLALVGVALALGGIPDDALPPITGLVLIVVSPLIYSVWIVLSARLAGERKEAVGDAGDGGTDAAAATALMMTGTAVTYWLTGLVFGVPLAPASIPAAAWPGLVGVGVVATFVAIQAFYAGARRVGAAQAALVSTIEPFYTIALAAFLFGESLAPLQLVGGGLIIAGVLIAQAPAEAFSSIRPGVRLADE
ncbi:MAG TPA: DMT family transporter [Candidatus Limnocylindrales bacterium]|nr:DMT family transporter [Candidatus Limnocylindrales bacterium]